MSEKCQNRRFKADIGNAGYIWTVRSALILLVPLELPGIFALGIEHPLDMTIQRLHDPNPRHHRRTAPSDQHQDLDRGLPFRQVGFLFRQASDVVGGVTKRDELAPIGQRYRVLEFALPALVSRQAKLPYLSSAQRRSLPGVLLRLGGSEEIPKSRELSDDLLR